MTLDELFKRLDDAVNALERIAAALDDVIDGGRVNVTARTPKAY